MAASSDPFIPISNRPVPLVARQDLVVRTMPFGDVLYRVVKDPLALKYYHLRPEQYLILDMLDGHQTLDDIRQSLQRHFPAIPVRIFDIQSLVTDLQRKELVSSTRIGQGWILQQKRNAELRKKIVQGLMSPFFFRLPGWRPDIALDLLTPATRWLFSTAGILAAVLFMVLALLQVAVRYDELLKRLPEFQQFFGWPNLIYLWLTIGFTKIIHELGHALACRFSGCDCHAIGFALLMFSPTMHCDATDAWMLPNKWKRIGISAAGMYFEVLLASCAICVWANTRVGLIHHMCLNIFFASTVTTVIFNLNPLVRFDGYYILSDWLEIPNLSDRGRMLLQRAGAWCLGSDLAADPFLPLHQRPILILYAMGAAAYRWVIMSGIFLTMYVILKPYRLQSVGIAWAYISVGLMLFGLVQGTLQVIRIPPQGPLHKVRRAGTLVGLSLLVLAAIFAPLPLYVRGAFYIEPQASQRVFVSVPGEVREIHVRPGQHVNEGDIMAVLENPEIERQLQKLAIQIQTLEVEVRTLHASESHEALVVKTKELHRIQNSWDELHKQSVQLTLRASATGTVIAPPRRPPQKKEALEERLATWSGILLVESNRGAFLEEGTLVAEIAPTERFQAVVLIDQAFRRDVRAGGRVDLQSEHLPLTIFRGNVKEVAHPYVQFVPRSLSNKFGGPLATVSDPAGRERLSSHAYQFVVDLPPEDQGYLTGMRGQARLLVTDRSAVEWAWHYVRKTFHFRL